MGKDELVEFDRAVNSILTTLAGGGKNMLGQTHYLAPTRQRAHIYYYVVKSLV